MANTNESYSGKINRKLRKKQRIVRVAAGLEPADLVLKHATYVNVFSNELCTADISVAEGLTAGTGPYEGRLTSDIPGQGLLPGILDSPIPADLHRVHTS